MDLSNFNYVGRSKGNTISFKLNERALSINTKGRIAISSELIDKDKIGSEGKGIGFMYNDIDGVVLLAIGHAGNATMLAKDKKSFNSTNHAKKIAATLKITPVDNKYRVFVGPAQELDNGVTIYQLTEVDLSLANEATNVGDDEQLKSKDLASGDVESDDVNETKDEESEVGTEIHSPENEEEESEDKQGSDLLP